MQPKISVIVPVYKAEKYLHRCVDSILAQNFTNFELILVNDGSPDNSGAICDEYAQKDNRVRIFHKENGGVSSARNLGLENAQGEWITFVDADDYIEDGFLDIPDSAQEDLLIQNYTFRGDSNNSIKFNRAAIKGECYQRFINENLHKEWLRVPWAKYFKKEIINNNNIKFPINVKIGEDAIFIQDYLYYTKSARYIASGNYIYKCDNNYDRYKLPVNNALEIFHRFISNYEKLKAESSVFLDFSFNFFWGLTDPQKHKKENRIWYRDRVVKKIYKTVRKQRNLKWWVKYNLYKILS